MWSCGNPIRSLWRRISLEFLVEVSASHHCVYFRRAGSNECGQFRGMQTVTVHLSWLALGVGFYTYSSTVSLIAPGISLRCDTFLTILKHWLPDTCWARAPCTCTKQAHRKCLCMTCLVTADGNRWRSDHGLES